MLYNNGGHVVIPDITFDADGIQAYTVYEGINPCTQRVTRLSTRQDISFVKKADGEFRTYQYLHNYVYSLHRKDAIGYASSRYYDIYSGQIVNGSARPYRGDRSVMTNLTGVKINIHSNSATILYLQKCNYIAGDRVLKHVPYVLGSFAPVADASPISIAITGDQVVLSSAQLQLLENGAYYGCYTDVDNTMEYFEYHNVTPGTYQKSNNNFTFNIAPFWYVCFSRPDPNSGNNTGEKIYVTIPYQSNDDYSRFRAAMNPADGIVASAFYKGTLGAYIVPLTAE